MLDVEWNRATECVVEAVPGALPAQPNALGGIHQQWPDTNVAGATTSADFTFAFGRAGTQEYARYVFTGDLIGSGQARDVYALKQVNVVVKIEKVAEEKSSNYHEAENLQNAEWRQAFKEWLLHFQWYGHGTAFQMRVDFLVVEACWTTVDKAMCRLQAAEYDRGVMEYLAGILVRCVDFFLKAFDEGVIVCDMHTSNIGLRQDECVKRRHQYIALVDAEGMLRRQDFRSEKDLQSQFARHGGVIVDDWLGHLGHFTAPEWKQMKNALGQFLCGLFKRRNLDSGRVVYVPIDTVKEDWVKVKAAVLETAAAPAWSLGAKLDVRV